MRALIGLPLALAAATMAAAGAAHAHHPVGGVAPQTLLDGFLSGIGHPVIGTDHLAFTLALGLAAGLLRGAGVVPAVFVLASLGGVLFHLAATDVPFNEWLVLASVLLAGLLLAFSRKPQMPRRAWIGFAMVAGLAHGYAYGEAVVGSEQGAVGAYLAGLALVQLALSMLALYAGRYFDARLGARWRVPAGAAVCALGVVLLVLASPQA